ncbi:uncharacterized protein EDB93DRAFT_1241775 [Suillus bovinus]|uniref:uncharacterized protein n=1 Tax=Suillus bovinus TaxID=48563 RepID=UPI001B87A742|nr:uncharacterized protein EDB93DRAFT_1241775 [Suillus bovinus]KAG2141421.1 hypothetical protein EDB93DRAFT_1241775 [Suillus bovinus]
MPLVAIAVTSFRLYCRARQRRLWIDDLWATFAMIFIFALLVVNSLYLQVNDIQKIFLRTRGISILLTVVRLTAPGTLRRVFIHTTMIFVILWAILSAQVLWTCESEPNWKTQSRPQCYLGSNVAIAQIITDVFGDTVLILAPVRLVYKARLSKAHKIRILLIFSTSAITTVVSLAHAYYVLSDGELKEAVAAIVETSVSLIVANLNVVVVFFLRMSADDDTSLLAPSKSSPIVTFGSWPRKRHFNDPLVMTVITVETTTITLTDLPETHPNALKNGNTDEISLNVMEREQSGELWVLADAEGTMSAGHDA